MIEAIQNLAFVLSGPYLPMIIIFGAAVVAAIFSIPQSPELARIVRSFSTLALFLVMVLLWQIYPSSANSPGANISCDRMTIIMQILAILSCISANALMTRSTPSTDQMSKNHALMLFLVLGVMAAISSVDLIASLIALEISSIAALAIITNLSERSEEIISRQFAIATLSTAFLVMGIAFIFGSAGSSKYAIILERAASIASSGGRIYLMFGIALTLIGLASKLSLFPLHGPSANLSINAHPALAILLLITTRIAPFVVLLTVAQFAIAADPANWSNAAWAIALLSMAFGSFASLKHEEIKGIIISASLFHGGLIVATLSAPETSNLGGAAFIMAVLSYVVSAICAFSALGALSSDKNSELDFGKLRGLFSKRPALAISIAISLLSLSGLPISIGFISRIFIVRSIVANGDIILLLATGLISLPLIYSCIRAISIMFHNDRIADKTEISPISAPLNIIITASTLTLLFFGIFPNNLIALITAALK